MYALIDNVKTEKFCELFTYNICQKHCSILSAQNYRDNR